MVYSNNEKIKMYKIMLMARLYDNTIVRESNKGKLTGMFHLGNGQEATGAGIVSAMGPKDLIMPGHRMHTANLYLMNLQKFTSELVGTINGYSKGVGAEYHCFSLKEGLFPIYSMLGGGNSHTTGYAYGMKKKNTGGVIISVVGDGGFTPGYNYEALNIAALMKLPIVFVVENNGWAVSTPVSKQAAVKDLSVRGPAFGIPGTTIEDGCDVLKVRKAMDEAIEKARNFEPTLVEVKTRRIAGHYFGDQMKYRDKKVEEEESRLHGDPIERFEKVLLEQQVITQDEINQLRNQLQEDINEAFNIAYSERKLTGEEARDLNMVYANVEGDLQ
jgi:acetoin:2,6-dichlorophenolindophenol oxidoreductase subunit alpha